MPEHRVGFVELLDAARHNVDANTQFVRQFLLLLTIMRNELMKRRINQANRYRKSVHGLENADEVATLERKKLVQSLHAGLSVVRKNHFLDGALPLVALFRKLEVREEHVLRAAQANALGTEFASFARVLGSVRIRANSKLTGFIRPLHKNLVGFRKLWHNERQSF